MKEAFKLFGVKLDIVKPKELKEELLSFLNEDRLKHIVTVNPAFLLEARHNEKFKNVLNGADIATIDGAGVALIAKLKGYKVGFSDRLTGVDLVNLLLQIADKENKKVLVVIPNDSLSSPKEILEALNKRYPKVKAEVRLVAELNQEAVPVDSDIIFVSLGSPDQDLWIANKHDNLLSHAKVAVGVGGTFDYISGKLQRAPKVYRSFGLEWLYRLFKRPFRMGVRAFKSTVIFPIIALFTKDE